GRLLGETALDQGREIGRHLGRERRGGRGPIAEDGGEQIGGGGAGEGALSGEELVEQYAEGEEIGAGVEGPAAGLLRGHVERGADEAPVLGHRGLGVAEAARGRLPGLGETEVEELD